MATQQKTWTSADFGNFADLNAEFQNIYSALNSGTAVSIADGSITEVKLDSGASPAVYFGELFQDGAVIAGGLAYSSKSGLDVTITSGTAYVLQTSTDPDKLVRISFSSTQTFTVQDNTTNYLDLGSDGVVDVTQSSTPATDHMRLLEVIASGGSITGTPTDLADRTFPDNSPQIKYFADVELDVTGSTAVVIRSGVTVADTTNVYTITTSSDLTLDITNSVGALGLDQGTESSSTWYAVVLIGDSTGVLDPSGILVDDSDYAGSIVLPSGYDIYRRLGYVRNDGSSDFLQGLQIGTTFSYDDEQSVSSSFSNTSFTDVTTSSFTAPTARLGHINVDGGETAGSSDAHHLWYSRDGASGSSGGVLILRSRSGSESFDRGWSAAHASNVALGTTANREISFRSAGTITAIYINGYEDTLND